MYPMQKFLYSQEGINVDGSSGGRFDVLTDPSIYLFYVDSPVVCARNIHISILRQPSRIQAGLGFLLLRFSLPAIHRLLSPIKRYEMHSIRICSSLLAGNAISSLSGHVNSVRPRKEHLRLWATRTRQVCLEAGALLRKLCSLDVGAGCKRIHHWHSRHRLDRHFSFFCFIPLFIVVVGMKYQPGIRHSCK